MLPSRLSRSFEYCQGANIFIMSSTFFCHNYFAQETHTFSCLACIQEENNIHAIKAPPSSFNSWPYQMRELKNI